MMAKTVEHTPGPWEVFIDDSGGKWSGWPLSIGAAYDDDKFVVRTGGQWPYEWDRKTSQSEAVANAHLIAAAPDLLDAVKGMVSMYVELVESGDAGFWDAEKVLEVIAARAAISKAEGRS